MKYKDLPKKWKAAIAVLSVSFVLLLFLLAEYVLGTLGSLLHVMLG